MYSNGAWGVFAHVVGQCRSILLVLFWWRCLSALAMAAALAAPLAAVDGLAPVSQTHPESQPLAPPTLPCKAPFNASSKWTQRLTGRHGSHGSQTRQPTWQLTWRWWWRWSSLLQLPAPKNAEKALDYIVWHIATTSVGHVAIRQSPLR